MIRGYTCPQPADMGSRIPHEGIHTWKQRPLPTPPPLLSLEPLDPVSWCAAARPSRPARLISQLRDQAPSGDFAVSASSKSLRTSVARRSVGAMVEGEDKGTFVCLSAPLTRSSLVALPSRKVGRLVPRANRAKNRANRYDRRLMVRLSACETKALAPRLFSRIERPIT